MRCLQGKVQEVLLQKDSELHQLEASLRQQMEEQAEQAAADLQVRALLVSNG